MPVITPLSPEYPAVMQAVARAGENPSGREIGILMDNREKFDKLQGLSKQIETQTGVTPKKWQEFAQEAKVEVQTPKKAIISAAGLGAFFLGMLAWAATAAVWPIAIAAGTGALAAGVLAYRNPSNADIEAQKLNAYEGYLRYVGQAKSPARAVSSEPASPAIEGDNVARLRKAVLEQTSGIHLP